MVTLLRLLFIRPC